MKIWTDGSCLGNPGPGGWAWASSPLTFESGFEPDTTNQRMELYAVIDALASYESEEPVTIITDSAYIVNCFRDNWRAGWDMRGFKKKTGAPVANWDLWTKLFLLVDEQEVTFEKVKGHSGDHMNEFVDDLARTAAMKGNLKI